MAKSNGSAVKRTLTNNQKIDLAADKAYAAALVKYDATDMRRFAARIARNERLAFQEGDQKGLRPKGVHCPDHEYGSVTQAMVDKVSQVNTLIDAE